MNINNDICKRQQGMSSLPIALTLLIGVTFVTLSTSKTALMEQQISANVYRTAQATAAADAALGYGIAYFDNGGFDQVDADADPDTIDIDYAADAPFALPLTSGDGSQQTNATVYFDNNDGVCTSDGDNQSAKIIATGFSDDGTAQRTISQCVGTLKIYRGDGPEQPLITRGAVGITGNFTIINRVNNIAIWSGSDVAIGNSSSAETYIWPSEIDKPGITLTNRDIFEDFQTPYTNVSVTSTEDLGSGIDIVDEDPFLSTLTGDEFFELFFSVKKNVVKQMAANLGQYYAGSDIDSVDGKTGVIWVEGDASMNGGVMGSNTAPVIMVVNGNLFAAGSPEIFGILYVVGQIDAKGTVAVVGSTIVEADETMVPAGEDAVKGTGSLDLVFSPFTTGASGTPIAGTTTVISGSWKDW